MRRSEATERREGGEDEREEKMNAIVLARASAPLVEVVPGDGHHQ
jgi:hypothetical protein